jgi:hypothetical protein
MCLVWKERPPILRVPGIEKLGRHGRDETWAPTLEGEPLPPRRRVLTPIQEVQATDQAKAWLGLGVIERIPDPTLLNNLVLVAKKDGRTRVCVDCTPANQCTRDFDWPLPRIQDIRYRLQGKTWFTRLDLKDAFFRISVPKQFRHLTAFKAGGQSYQFRRMPFGLKTAPAVFQRFMDQGLAPFWEWAIWYIDDILISAASLPELRARTRDVRQRLQEMKCEINEAKSEENKRSLLFVGLWVTGEGVGPNLQHVRTLQGIPAPSTKAEAQSALGLVSYLRDFVPLVGHFTAQLYPDKQGLRLDKVAYEAQWGLLVRHLVSAISLTHHWRQGVAADLYTDASQYALGIVLLQEGRLVAVASRKLTPAETRYSATDREHLGLLFAAKKFRMILHQPDAKTRVWSDHNALLTRKLDELTPRQARWATTVNAWIPNVVHVRGKNNPADFVSRWRFDGVGAKF